MNKRPEKPFSFSLLTDVHWAAQDTHEYLEFSGEVEARLVQAVAELEEKIEQRLKEIPKEHWDDFIESEVWTTHKYQELFPTLHRESMFVTLYSYLEHQLNSLCKQIGEELETKIKLNDIRGAGFERALLYLRRVPEFDFQEINDEISFLRSANRLRNIIVHAGGILPTDKKDKANKFVASEETLSGEPGSLVAVSPSFIDLFAENIRPLFDEIGNAMQRYMDLHVRGKE